jgi:hypothetical protein
MREDFTKESLENLISVSSYNSWLSRLETKAQLTILQDVLIEAAGMGYRTAKLSEFTSSYATQMKLTFKGVSTILHLDNIYFIIKYLQDADFNVAKIKSQFDRTYKEYEIAW